MVAAVSHLHNSLNDISKARLLFEKTMEEAPTFVETCGKILDKNNMAKVEEGVFEKNTVLLCVFYCSIQYASISHT